MGLVAVSIVGHTDIEEVGVVEVVGSLSVSVLSEVPVVEVVPVGTVGISGQREQSYRSRKVSATVSLKLWRGGRGGEGEGSIIMTQGLYHQAFN